MPLKTHISKTIALSIISKIDKSNTKQVGGKPTMQANQKIKIKLNHSLITINMIEFQYRIYMQLFFTPHYY